MLQRKKGARMVIRDLDEEFQEVLRELQERETSLIPGGCLGWRNHELKGIV